MDHTDRRRPADIRHLLGAMMSVASKRKRAPATLDVVALLASLPEHRLARGNVGTIVEELDDKTVLVEFSDDDGRSYAIAPCLRSELLTLHYVPEAA
ncbi:DUF4926 domain-containing protein [Bradyrhizobium sp. BR 1432]|uniref:DUF4926 domain-containing protein n=1 Tax=Bradyrhizobium sp. BR 1432 TaxID=3447966 RepID=UPI003EE78EE9